MSDDRQVLLSLLESAGPRLHALLTRLTLREDVAEELLQDLFLGLSERNGFSEADNKEAYAFQVARHLAFDWRRRNRRRESTPLAADREVGQASPLSALIDREQLEQVLDAANKLTALGREVFVMRFIQQQSYEIIATKLGKTPHQVRGLCHKAVKDIRRLLSDSRSHSTRKEVPDARH